MLQAALCSAGTMGHMSSKLGENVNIYTGERNRMQAWRDVRSDSGSTTSTTSVGSMPRGRKETDQDTATDN